MLPRSAASDWPAVRRRGLQNYTPGAERAFKLMTKRGKKKKTTMASFFALPSLLLFSNRRRAVSAEETETEDRESGAITVASCRKSIRLAPSQIKQMAVGSMAQPGSFLTDPPRRSARKLRGQDRVKAPSLFLVLSLSTEFPILSR